MAIDEDALANDAAIRRESTLPIGKTQNHNWTCIKCLIVRTDKKSSCDRAYTQNLKIITRYQLSANNFRLIAPLHADIHGVSSNHSRKDRIAVADVLI